MTRITAGMIRGRTAPGFLVVIAFCSGVIVACGGGGGTTTRERNPTGPSPRETVPPATVQLDGNGQLSGCVQANARIRCEFAETGKNAGPGCATAVRGNVRLMAGDTEIASQGWSLPETRVLMPNEEFNYTVTIGGLPDSLASVDRTLNRVMWTNTRC